jgi:hypothetical protein
MKWIKIPCAFQKQNQSINTSARRVSPKGAGGCAGKKYIATMKWILFFGCFIFAVSGFAQNCLPGGITFTTQAAIDNFAADYPGCTTIDGFVVIEESVAGNITDLSGLLQLQSIFGDLFIKNNTALVELNGLQNIQFVGDSLRRY